MALLVMPAATAVMLAVPAVLVGVQTMGVVSETQVPAQIKPVAEMVAIAVLPL